MGPFGFGNELFFSLSVLTTVNFIERKLASEKPAQPSH